MSTARLGTENGIIQRRDRTCRTVGLTLGKSHSLSCGGEFVNIRGIDNCDMPSVCRWLLLMIVTKSSQENVNTLDVPYLTLWDKKPAL
jgi:hypothetical protein